MPRATWTWCGRRWVSRGCPSSATPTAPISTRCTAELFPHRAGRMVLDSAIDPARPGAVKGTENGPLREAALREWAGWAARHDDRYHGSGQPTPALDDAPVPRKPERYRRDIEAHRAEAPLFGPLTRNISPCAFWPAAPAGPPVRVHNAVPALVVSAEGDIDADLTQGRAMHRALTGSRMITLAGVRTHGVYLFRGAGCVDDAVNAYLATGTLPAHDLTCVD